MDHVGAEPTHRLSEGARQARQPEQTSTEQRQRVRVEPKLSSERPRCGCHGHVVTCLAPALDQRGDNPLGAPGLQLLNRLEDSHDQMSRS
jgi:hypothetical protein